MSAPDLRAFDELVDEMRADLDGIDLDQLEAAERKFVENLRAAIARYDADDYGSAEIDRLERAADHQYLFPPACSRVLQVWS